jgi:hypothetical protein
MMFLFGLYVMLWLIVNEGTSLAAVAVALYFYIGIAGKA